MKISMSGETIESLLYYENKAILELKISYPQIMGQLTQKSEYRFNNYYRTQARNLNRRARTEIYRKAVEDARFATRDEYDFTLHSFIRTFSAVRTEPRYTSVVFDQYQFSGGPHGFTVRTAETWDLSAGRRCPLSDFFLPHTAYKKIIIKYVRSQITEQKKREEISFFEDPLRNALIHFNESNFYLTTNGISIFYPLYTLAPYHEGILTYNVPFSEFSKIQRIANFPKELPSNVEESSPYFGTSLL